MSSLTFTDQEFAAALHEAREFYRTLGKIRCPYFQDNVRFNAQGFERLRHKSWNRGRARRDQFQRLKHLASAPEILSQSRTVQGIKPAREWNRERKYGRWEKRLVPVMYYEFVAMLEAWRFKVIVKQLPDGRLLFWNLIPLGQPDGSGRHWLPDDQPAQD